MSLDSYLIFVGASIILCIVPGPDMAYLLARSIAQGRKAGFIAALGINAGAYTHLFAAIIGISAILATSAVAFSILKWVGAAYLIYIGVQAFRNRGALNIEGTKLKGRESKKIFWQGFLSDALNPKVAVFYLAFLPQFVSPEGINPTLQLLILGVTVNMVGIIVSLILVYFSTLATEKLRNNNAFTTWLNRAMGTVFVALGVKLASERT